METNNLAKNMTIINHCTSIATIKGIKKGDFIKDSRHTGEVVKIDIAKEGGHSYYSFMIVAKDSEGRNAYNKIEIAI